MANKNEIYQEKELDDMYTWVANVHRAKSKKSLTRDFSNAVPMAEILKVYYPRYVDLHNYPPANNVNAKINNWNLLNRKVLAKIDMKLNNDRIHQLANSHPGAAEQLLLELKNKIFKIEEGPRSSRSPEASVSPLIAEDRCEDAIREERTTGNSFESNETSSDHGNASPRPKGRIVRFVIWLLSWLSIFNILRLFDRRNAQRNTQTNSIRVCQESEENRNTVPQRVLAELQQKLREKNDIISTLNHKVAYLESAMKLKDLRIANLSTQILQNTVDTMESPKMKSSESPQRKSRSRSEIVQNPK